jgi:hypothetical protein
LEARRFTGTTTAGRATTTNLDRIWSCGQTKTGASEGASKKQLAAHERETAASRPYHQFLYLIFLYQISREREWIEDDMWGRESAGPVDVEALAYEAIKTRWIKQKMWNHKWGNVPGMVWTYEESDEYDFGIEYAADVARKEGSRAGANGSGACLLDLPSRHEVSDFQAYQSDDDNCGRITSPVKSSATVQINGFRQASPHQPKWRSGPHANNSSGSEVHILHKVKPASIRKSGRPRRNAGLSDSFGKFILLCAP